MRAPGATQLDGSPCKATKTLAETEMTCVQQDCDGEHHFFQEL